MAITDAYERWTQLLYPTFKSLKQACYFRPHNSKVPLVPCLSDAAYNIGEDLCSHPSSISCFCLEKQAVSSPYWQSSHEEIPPPKPDYEASHTILPSLGSRCFPICSGSCCSPQPITPGEPLAPFLCLFFLLQEQLFEFHPKITLT